MNKEKLITLCKELIEKMSEKGYLHISVIQIDNETPSEFTVVISQK